MASVDADVVAIVHEKDRSPGILTQRQFGGAGEVRVVDELSQDFFGGVQFLGVSGAEKGLIDVVRKDPAGVHDHAAYRVMNFLCLNAFHDSILCVGIFESTPWEEYL
ncbi:MAG: hypothetical protein PWP17_1426 [Desulfomicrobiaceae bacterium]|nr:hypothetical protein [Desulfomicrobiaceae bacterium]